MIQFHYSYSSFKIKGATKIKAWLENTAISEKKKIQRIDFIFVDDEALRNINKQTLHHDYYTDILTFPYSYRPIEGELYISIDRIKDHSIKYAVPFNHELTRVMVHGLLHLCGYDDKSEKNKTRMTQKENQYLDLLFRK